MAGSSNTPKEVGQGSTPPAFPHKRDFTKEELHFLFKRFSAVELNWAMNNNTAPTGKFLNKIINVERAKENREKRRQLPPQPEIPPADPTPEVEHVDSDSDPEYAPTRQCHNCKYLSPKKVMVKCRKCGYWFDTWCQAEPNRKGRNDPHFRFWLCFQCAPDPKKDPGYKFRYYSKAEIEADAHYEDTDTGIYGTDTEPDERAPL